jgi:hypothetical protein
MTVDSDEIRDARRKRQFHSARDFETSASQIEDVEPPDADMKLQTQLIIAANAKGRSKADKVADATLMMRMLGVHPDDDFDPNASPLVPHHPTAR